MVILDHQVFQVVLRLLNVIRNLRGTKLIVSMAPFWHSLGTKLCTFSSFCPKADCGFGICLFFPIVNGCVLSQGQIVLYTMEVWCDLFYTIHRLIPVLNYHFSATRHICCRCGKPFVILESGEYPNMEECVYHHGRLLRSRSKISTLGPFKGCMGLQLYKGYRARVKYCD